MAALSAKIEENETLANMKKQASAGANKATTYMSNLFGWEQQASAANAATEEVKTEASAANADGEIAEEETKEQLKETGGADDGFMEPSQSDDAPAATMESNNI